MNRSSTFVWLLFCNFENLLQNRTNRIQNSNRLLTCIFNSMIMMHIVRQPIITYNNLYQPITAVISCTSRELSLSSMCYAHHYTSIFITRHQYFCIFCAYSRYSLLVFNVLPNDLQRIFVKFNVKGSCYLSRKFLS